MFRLKRLRFRSLFFAFLSKFVFFQKPGTIQSKTIYNNSGVNNSYFELYAMFQG